MVKKSRPYNNFFDKVQKFDQFMDAIPVGSKS